MTTAKNGMALLAAVMFLSACATGFEAIYDHDSTKDFSGYRSYAWISEHPMKIGATERIPSPLLEPRIMASVENTLNAKGYTKVIDSRSADFVLAFTVGSREEIRVDQYSTMSRPGYGYGHWGWGGAYYGGPYGTETIVRQYTRGMLAIDIFDVEERRPVWHGVAEKKISEADREDAEGTVNAAVNSLLVGFPPH